jgi:hypothetical protein
MPYYHTDVKILLTQSIKNHSLESLLQFHPYRPEKSANRVEEGQALTKARIQNNNLTEANLAFSDGKVRLEPRQTYPDLYDKLLLEICQ